MAFSILRCELRKILDYSFVLLHSMLVVLLRIQTSFSTNRQNTMSKTDVGQKKSATVLSILSINNSVYERHILPIHISLCSPDKCRPPKKDSLPSILYPFLTVFQHLKLTTVLSVAGRYSLSTIVSGRRRGELDITLWHTQNTFFRY